MEQKQYKRIDRSMHIAEYFYTEIILSRLLPYISKTFLTPNMVTSFNFAFSFFTFYLAYNEKYIAVAFLIQMYLFFDILDGNLARYKNLHSNFGARLDQVSDRTFYTLIFVSIGINHVNYFVIGSLIFLVHIYGIIATYYIVPRIRKLNRMDRRGIKKFFMDRGFIVGMDLGTLDILMSLFLLFGKIELMFTVLIIGYVFDITYRLLELKRNERISGNIKESLE